MTFLVPFDGSELAEAALVRATEFSTALNERVLAISVIPKDNVEYARSRGWIGPDEEFSVESAVSTLHEQVTDLSPSADFRHELVSHYAPSGIISKRIKRVAREVDASMIFIGSENAGRLMTAISSVGGTVASTSEYDVLIVRERNPAKIEKIRDQSPYDSDKSDFYPVDC